MKVVIDYGRPIGWHCPVCGIVPGFTHVEAVGCLHDGAEVRCIPAFEAIPEGEREPADEPDDDTVWVGEGPSPVSDKPCRLVGVGDSSTPSARVASRLPCATPVEGDVRTAWTLAFGTVLP